MAVLIKPVHITGVIIKNDRISPSTSQLTIKTEGLPPFSPGQFCQVSIEHDGETLKRPYSIASAPWEQHLELCIKEAGKMSNALIAKRPGDTLGIISPYGLFTLPEHLNDQHYLFISVGTGVAPFRSMVRTLFRQYYTGKGEDTDRQVTLLFGARTKKETLYQEEFEQLSSERENFKYHVTLSREDVDGKLRGYVQHHLATVLPEPSTTSVFLCGLKDMVAAVNNELITRGIPKEHIHQESY